MNYFKHGSIYAINVEQNTTDNRTFGFGIDCSDYMALRLRRNAYCCGHMYCRRLYIHHRFRSHQKEVITVTNCDNHIKIMTLSLLISRKSVGRADTNIEASHESMIESDPNVTGQVSRRLRSRNASTMSDESVVLQQSDFMPHTVSAIIENENKPRDSLISNNELPPSYEEAKNLPILSLKA